MYQNFLPTNPFTQGMTFNDIFSISQLKNSILYNQAFQQECSKQEFLGFPHNPYVYNPLQLSSQIKIDIPRGQRQQFQDVSECLPQNGQFLTGLSVAMTGKQKIANHGDQIQKNKRLNKDISKNIGGEQKKLQNNNGTQNNAIIIDDDEEEKEIVNNSKQSTNINNSLIETLEFPIQIENQRNNNTLDEMNSAIQTTDKLFAINNSMDQTLLMKNIEKCDDTLLSTQNSQSKPTNSTTQSINQEDIVKNNEKEDSIIILSDDEDEFNFSSLQNQFYFQKRQFFNYFNDIPNDNTIPVIHNSFSKKLFDSQNSFSNSQFSNSNSQNIGIYNENESQKMIQYEKLLQPSQRNPFGQSFRQNRIPIHEPQQKDINCQMKFKDDDLTIEQIINPYKMHFNNYQNPIKQYSFDYQNGPFQLSFNSQNKNKLKSNYKLFKKNSSSPINIYKANVQQKKSKSFSSIQKQYNDSIKYSHSSFKASQLQKSGDSSSPRQNQNSQTDEKDGKLSRKSSKFLYCKKCDKQIESNQFKKGTLQESSDLCKLCYYQKQKNEQQEKRYWEQVFLRNSEDRINQIEVGPDFQAVIPDHSMKDQESWKQSNKEKLEAILANKVHSSDNAQTYTDVIAQIRSKYNENYSHNDFLALIKNTKLSLPAMKEKMEEDDQLFLSIIETCSSSTCKNQRVTRLTKRRLEYLQNY